MWFSVCLRMSFNIDWLLENLFVVVWNGELCDGILYFFMELLFVFKFMVFLREYEKLIVVFFDICKLIIFFENVGELLFMFIMLMYILILWKFLFLVEVIVIRLRIYWFWNL